MPPWILVSPSSRGIGLELARRLLRSTTLPIVATARTNLDATRNAILQNDTSDSASRLTVLPLDVTDEDTISAAAEHCHNAFPSSKDSPSHLHLALVLPGILHPEKSPAQISADAALATFRVNTLGPLLMLKHFAPFLPRRASAMPTAGDAELGPLPADHATWAAMSARVGSIGDNRAGGWYSYRASKAAVNQVVRTFDNHLRAQAGNKALAVGLHPGTVKTGLSKEFWGSVPEEKLFSVEYAAEKLLEVVCGLGEEDRGKCWDWKGEEIPP